MSASDLANLRRLASDRAESDPLAAYAMNGAADEIERLRHALEVIAGRKPASDNLMGNIQIAEDALDQ